MPRALALSPHLDDAVFSAGAALAALAAAGWEVTVATAFTASVPNPAGFALACQLDKGLGPEIDYMALRRDEDAAACAALGAAPVWLGLPEAPHRGYGSAPELFAAVRPEDDADRRLTALFPPLMEGVDLLLAPQAIGGHVDHIIAVRALDRAPRPPTLWWADFPYTIRGGNPPEPFADRFGALPELAMPSSAAAQAAKAAACAAYASQLGFQFGGREGLIAALAGAPVEPLRAEPAAAARLDRLAA